MTQPITFEYDHGITCIDTHFQRIGMASCYLIVEQGRCALIDTGTRNTVEMIEQVMADNALKPEDMDYIIPTHVHLDHAGGAGELMRRMPNAKLIVHPRGARHMIDPSKLQAGATVVYGEEVFKRDYVELIPIPEERVIEAEDGHTESLNGRTLKFIDTPGHASHHFCIWDEQSEGFFTGDTFGLSYREFDTDQGAFIIPPTTPVQFKPDAWHDSLDRMMDRNPKRMYLTHYGKVEEVERLLKDLREGIDNFVDIAKKGDGSENRYQAISKGISSYLIEKMRDHGVEMQDQAIKELLATDIDLNTQGLEVWLDKQKAA